MSIAKATAWPERSDPDYEAPKEVLQLEDASDDYLPQGVGVSSFPANYEMDDVYHLHGWWSEEEEHWFDRLHIHQS